MSSWCVACLIWNVGLTFDERNGWFWSRVAGFGMVLVLLGCMVVGIWMLLRRERRRTYLF